MFRKLIMNTMVIFGLAYALTGVSVDSIWTALAFSIVLGLLNIFLKPILLLLSIPINILTLGLFTIIINTIIVMIADYLVAGFVINNFSWALLFSLIISIINSLFGVFKK